MIYVHAGAPKCIVYKCILVVGGYLYDDSRVVGLLVRR